MAVRTMARQLLVPTMLPSSTNKVSVECWSGVLMFSISRPLMSPGNQIAWVTVGKRWMRHTGVYILQTARSSSIPAAPTLRWTSCRTAELVQLHGKAVYIFFLYCAQAWFLVLLGPLPKTTGVRRQLI